MYLILCLLLTLSFYSTSGLDLKEANDDLRTLLLDLHNEKRVKYDSQLIDLDDEANQVAQKCAKYYAEIGKIDESCPDKGEKYGENLFQVANKKQSTTVEDVVRGAIKFWYEDQKDNYDFATGNPKDPKKRYLGFTQLVWKASTKLGVGMVNTDKHIFLVALYDPAGNMDEEFTQNVKQKA